MADYHPEDWRYVRVRGLGLIEATGCPHRDGEKRHADFVEMIGRRGGVGIALDDCAAIEIVGKRYRVITSRKGAEAYRVEKVRGKVKAARIAVKKEFSSLQLLLDRSTGQGSPGSICG